MEFRGLLRLSIDLEAIKPFVSEEDWKSASKQRKSWWKRLFG